MIPLLPFGLPRPAAGRPLSEDPGPLPGPEASLPCFWVEGPKEPPAPFVLRLATGPARTCRTACGGWGRGWPTACPTLSTLTLGMGGFCTSGGPSQGDSAVGGLWFFGPLDLGCSVFKGLLVMMFISQKRSCKARWARPGRARGQMGFLPLCLPQL